MAKKNDKKKPNAKQLAYAKKQEQQGARVVKWIGIVLILLALAYVGWQWYMMTTI